MLVSILTNLSILRHEINVLSFLLVDGLLVVVVVKIDCYFFLVEGVATSPRQATFHWHLTCCKKVPVPVSGVPHFPVFCVFFQLIQSECGTAP